MRSVAVVLLLLFASGLAVAAAGVPPTIDGKELAPLSKRYLAALQSGKIEDAMACWASVERMKKLMEDPPEGLPRPTPEEIKKAVEYFRKRDEAIRKRLPAIIKRLKANNADPKKLTYVRAKGIGHKTRGFERVTTVNMVFRSPDGTEVELSVDDGAKLDGKWYFTDKPFTHINLTKDGKPRMLTPGRERPRADAEKKAEGKSEEKDFTGLSRRYLAALQSEKVDDCIACWVSMKQLMEHLPKGTPKPSPKELEEGAEYFRQRDKIIKGLFLKTIKALKANVIDPKKLTYVKSDGRVRTGRKLGVEITGGVDMFFKFEDGTSVKLSVDDGMKLDGKWYFSDKPFPRIVLTKDGKKRTVFIED